MAHYKAQRKATEHLGVIVSVCVFMQNICFAKSQERVAVSFVTIVAFGQ
jgi:hypothetical protein